MPFTVYALFDEREPDEVRYVGFSANPERRFFAHLGEAQRLQRSTHRLNWIRKVVADGALVHWKVLEVFATIEDALAGEVVSIKWHLENGHRLTNGTPGGEGIPSTDYWASEDSKEHQRRQMLEHWSSPEAVVHRQIVIEANKRIQIGLKRSDEAKEKMRQKKLGKPHPHTKEWDAKISAAQKGKSRPAWSEERKAAHAVRLADPITRAKMSESAKTRGPNNVKRK